MQRPRGRRGYSSSPKTMGPEVCWNVKVKQKVGDEVGCIAVQAVVKKVLVTPLEEWGAMENYSAGMEHIK